MIGSVEIGSVETTFDGMAWCNRVVGSYILAISRDTAERAEAKGREMAQVRGVVHVVLNQDGSVRSRTEY